MERYIVVGMHERKRVEDGIEITPWQDFLDELWNAGL